MATAIRKITLSSSRDIPFNKLVLSQSNVRRVKAGVSVEELADSIARRGLIQSLHVRPILDEEGKETGMFEVPAGGRRYRALELLAKQKRLARTTPVPCVVGDPSSDILVEEVSLVENLERAPLHPLDQFRAFAAMRDKGMNEEAIAAAFLVDAKVVKQRLRLAAVSSKLLEVYADDKMTLEQLMAFTVIEDHARQEQVWEAIHDGWQNEPWHIRRMLTETAVRASDKRALFVGVDAYEAAGGVVLRDLFQSDDGGWLQNVGLLERMVADKLKLEAEKVAAEGWRWVEAHVNIPYGATHGLRELAGVPIGMSEDEQAKRIDLQIELDRLTDEYEGVEELPDEIDRRFGELEAEIETLDHRPMRYDPAEIAIAGVFITIDADGGLDVDRGFVRPEDKTMRGAQDDEGQAERDIAETDAPVHAARPVSIVAGELRAPEDSEEDEGVKPLPDRLMSELTAHRTLALRDALAQNPRIALTALLHKLAASAFLHLPAFGALEVNVRHVAFPAQAEDLNDSPSARSIDRRHEDWRNRIPADESALWDFIDALGDDERMALLAHCVSYGLNALYERPIPYGGAGVSEHGLRLRLAQADRLARETGLDMAQAGWRPTVGNYLGRVTRARILDAVREGAGDRAAQLIDHMKKGDMAREAERLLADSGWLPEPLRLVDDGAAMGVEADNGEGGEEALPAFLTDDGEDEEAIDAEDDETRAVAAAE
jgi:ParB family chromosome partitioning protein